MRMRLRPANVIVGSFDRYTIDCVLSLQVDFVCAERSSGSCKAVVVKLEGGSCKPSRRVQEITLRCHLLVDVLYILFVDFRRHRCFDPRSFFFGVPFFSSIRWQTIVGTTNSFGLWIAIELRLILFSLMPSLKSVYVVRSVVSMSGSFLATFSSS